MHGFLEVLNDLDITLHPLITIVIWPLFCLLLMLAAFFKGHLGTIKQKQFDLNAIRLQAVRRSVERPLRLGSVDPKAAAAVIALHKTIEILEKLYKEAGPNRKWEDDLNSLESVVSLLEWRALEAVESACRVDYEGPDKVKKVAL